MTQQRIKVLPGELTCLACGETFPADFSGCPRCTDVAERLGRHGSGYKRTPTVPTTSYLKEEEYTCTNS